MLWLSLILARSQHPSLGPLKEQGCYWGVHGEVTVLMSKIFECDDEYCSYHFLLQCNGSIVMHSMIQDVDLGTCFIHAWA